MNDLDYLISQLNLLIGFLDVSSKQVFNQIEKYDPFNLNETIGQLYNNRYENYLSHFTNSALLLGFAHFEDFITKVIIELLTRKPNLNEYKITIKVFNEKGDYVADFLAKEQARKMIFSEKLKFIEKNIVGIDGQNILDIRFVSEVRNCLMHNNGLADQRLMPKYRVGEKINFSSENVHEYGLLSRQLARHIWSELNNEKT